MSSPYRMSLPLSSAPFLSQEYLSLSFLEVGWGEVDVGWEGQSGDRKGLPWTGPTVNSLLGQTNWTRNQCRTMRHQSQNLIWSPREVAGAVCWVGLSLTEKVQRRGAIPRGRKGLGNGWEKGKNGHNRDSMELEEGAKGKKGVMDAQLLPGLYLFLPPEQCVSWVSFN